MPMSAPRLYDFPFVPAARMWLAQADYIVHVKLERHSARHYNIGIRPLSLRSTACGSLQALDRRRYIETSVTKKIIGNAAAGSAAARAGREDMSIR